MFDLSRSVAGGLCQFMSALTEELTVTRQKLNTRHVSIGYQVDESCDVPAALTSIQSIQHLRTLLLVDTDYGLIAWRSNEANMSVSTCKKLIKSFPCLRTLYLHDRGIKKLPECISKLVHLRNLDLSRNPFKELPDSITLLNNLQFLDLNNCRELRRLPGDMRKLINLRHLQLSAPFLGYIPSGLGDLTHLRDLSGFVVSAGNSAGYSARLSDLSTLNNLRGQIHIFIRGEYQDMACDAAKANLHSKKDLRNVVFCWRIEHNNTQDEEVLENLRPPNNISSLDVFGFQGINLPTWMATTYHPTPLAHLTKIRVFPPTLQFHDDGHPTHHHHVPAPPQPDPPP